MLNVPSVMLAQLIPCGLSGSSGSTGVNGSSGSSGSQPMHGGSSSVTITVNVHSAVLPEKSVAVQVTVVVPILK